MVIDTSALIAVMGDEPERHAFNESIEAATATCIGAATLLETSMVSLVRSGDNAFVSGNG